MTTPIKGQRVRVRIENQGKHIRSYTGIVYGFAPDGKLRIREEATGKSKSVYKELASVINQIV